MEKVLRANISTVRGEQKNIQFDRSFVLEDYMSEPITQNGLPKDEQVQLAFENMVSCWHDELKRALAMNDDDLLYLDDVTVEYAIKDMECIVGEIQKLVSNVAADFNMDYELRGYEDAPKNEAMLCKLRDELENVYLDLKDTVQAEHRNTLARKNKDAGNTNEFELSSSNQYDEIMSFIKNGGKK